MKVLHLSRLISATRLSVDEHPEKAEESFHHCRRLSSVSSCHSFLVFLSSLFDLISHFNQTITALVTGVASNKKSDKSFFRLDNQNVGEDIVQNSFLDALVLLFFYSVSQMSLSADSRVFKSQWQIIVLLHLNDSVPSIFTASKKTTKSDGG